MTLMSANHCPGSAVMLFELPSGKTYLHTGDFRFNQELFSTYEPLKPFFKKRDPDDTTDAKQLTAIYLDTTYCDPIYTFPKQMDAIKLITNIVKEKKRQGKKILSLIGTYYIGKERIAQNIAKECDCKIFVTIDKHKAIKCLGLPDEDKFTMNPQQTDVHIVSMSHLGWKKLFENRVNQGTYDEIIAFRPSAWCFKELAEESSMVPDVPSGSIKTVPVNFTRRSNITVVDVPYSEHSSFAELRQCVELLNTKKIVPTVYRSKDQMNKMLYYLSDQYCMKMINLKLSIPDDLINANAKPASAKKKQPEPVKDSTVRTLFDMAKKGVNFVKSSFFATAEPKKLVLKKSPMKDSPAKSESFDDSQISHGSEFGMDDSQSMNFDDSQQLNFGMDDDFIDMEAFDIKLQQTLLDRCKKENVKQEEPDVIVIDDEESQSSTSGPSVTPVKDTKEEPAKKKLILKKRKVDETLNAKTPAKKKVKITPPPQKSTLMSFWSKK